MGIETTTQQQQLVRLCVISEDKETTDIIVNEEDTIWALKIKIFEHTTLFPGKQSITFKNPDETQAVPIQLSNEKTVRDYNLKSGHQVLLSRAASQHEPKSSSSRGGGFLGLLSKKVGCPKLCFAIGRPLKKAVVGGSCCFNIHKVDTRGKQIKSEDDFEIDIVHQKDNTKVNYRYEKSSGIFSTVVFTPQKNGEYKIYIRLDGADISGSPYRGVAIDETTPKIRELAFNQDWVTEITQLYSLLARAETVDNIFLVGHEGLLHLMRNGSRQIQHDMTIVFAHLIKKDDNKGRLVKDMGINLLKLLKTDYWMAHLEIKCFVARFLVILAISEENCMTILDEVGTLPLAGLARTPNPECSRGCAKVLCLMSDHLSTRLRLVKDTVFSVMYYLMQQEDIVTTYDTLSALANLCHIDDAQNLIKENFPMVVFIASKVNSENIHLRMQSLKILSVLTARAEFAQRLFAHGIHNVLVQHAEGFMAGLVFEWETQSAKLLYSKNTTGEEDPKYQDAMVKLLKAQFKDDIGCAQYSAIILANLHQHNMDEMGSFIVKGACLRMLRRMVRSADIVTQIEACKIVTTLSGPEQPQEIKEALVTGGMVIALMQAVSVDKPVLLGHIMCTIANICRFNRVCLEMVNPAELDKLLAVLLQGGPATERDACLVLGNMVAIDRYRTKIVQSGGHRFFTHVIELVRVGELDLLPEIGQSELRVIKKIGKGVSGVVWKAEWKNQIVAVKSFNESNIAFNVDEFASEMALMSILRHKHVMHCLGGSRWAKKLFLVSEYFGKGSLYDILHKRKIRLSLERILQVAIDTAEGLTYLHNLGLIHRDIKPGNLLIASDWTVKIGDFGVSRVVAKRMTRAVGTPCYMAPEVLEGQEYTQAADVYSYAFVLWEMVTRETPFKDIPHLEMAKLVVEDKQRPTLPVDCPEPLKELVESCWHPVPSKRPSIADVLTFLQNLKSSYTEGTLATIILPGEEDEEEEEDDTASNDSSEQHSEAQEHEKEWELLCQQYKREKSRLKQKEGAKVKGRSDSVFKSSSGSKKDSKALTQSKESDTPLTPTQSIPFVPSFESPSDDTPLGRPRSYSALPLIRIPQANDPIPPIINDLTRMSPLARDIPNVPRGPPRNQLDVFVEMMVRGAQSVTPANMEVIIDSEEKKEDDRPPRPPRAHPSPPANYVLFKDEELEDEGSMVKTTSDSSTMPTIAEELSPKADNVPAVPFPEPSTSLPRPELSTSPPKHELSASPHSHEVSTSPPTHELSTPPPRESEVASPITIEDSGLQPLSPEAGYPSEDVALARPPPKRGADDSQKSALPHRATTLTRHQHVPSPKLYRSNTAMLPQNRSLPPHKSFTSVTPPQGQHFTNVVLKPSPHRPADVQWSGTDSSSPYKAGDGYAAEAELSRGKSESSGLFAFQGEQPDSVTPSRLRSNSADGTPRSRSNSTPQKANSPVNDTTNGAKHATLGRPSSATSPPKVESTVPAVSPEKDYSKDSNKDSTGITRRHDALRESNDSTREIPVPYRSDYSSSDSLSWSSQGSKSIESSAESSKSGNTSTSTSIANSTDSLKSSLDSIKNSSELKKGPTASDLVRLFAAMGDTNKSSQELTRGQLIRKTSADTISGKKEGGANLFGRKVSSDSIRSSSPVTTSPSAFMAPPVASVSRSADSVLPNPNVTPPIGSKDLLENRKPAVPPRTHVKQGSADSALRDKEKDNKDTKAMGRSDSSPSFTVPPSLTSPTPEEKQPTKQSSTRRLFFRG